jgi:hypothetical protein
MTAINYVVRWHLGETNQKDAVITLPLRLRSRQNGFGGHWARAAGLNRKERQLASWACGGPLAEYRQGLAKAYVGSVVVTITRIAPRELDDDNLRTSAKAVRDGIADALGLKSDRDKRLTWNYSQEKGKPGEYAVRITVMGRAA